MMDILKPALLFQDQDILVIDKPSHLLSVPDGYDPTLPHLRRALESEFGSLWMVHRLDKETSGVVVLARNAESHRILNETFRNHKVQKHYHGLVSPVPKWREKVIELPLVVNADRRHRTRADERKGKPAWSHCRILKIFPQAALMSIEIRTGVTHQIRAHIRSQEIAFLGDTLYQAGLAPQPVSAPRVMLHAREIVFPHPNTNQTVRFTAPYPNDFRDLLNELAATRGQDNGI